jgi:hypothetical protein
VISKKYKQGSGTKFCIKSDIFHWERALILMDIRQLYTPSHIKHNPTIVTYTVQISNQKQVHLCVIDLLSLPWRSIQGHHCCWAAAHASCATAARVQTYFVHEQNVCTSKSCAAVCEAFSNAYLDNVISNKTTIYRLRTKFRDTGNFCVSSRSWWATAVELFFKFSLTNRK